MTANNTAKKYDSVDFKESHFGIRNKEDLVHIFNVLRNKMYVNKILAVLREYSTNACDAHIESNQRDRPIEVTLPTSQNRVLSIRDFGTGLSEDNIRNVYTMYGASTKRGSSELNGQLGFGSKAAFSYVDSYIIVCYHNNTKTIYEAYVDETGLGAITQISTEPTTEPSGIEIQVKVQAQDVNNFCDTAVKLYKHFKVTPNVTNLGNRKIEKPVYKLRGTTWGLRTQQGYSYGNENVVVMGNVAYPLSRQVLHDNFKQYPNWDRYESLITCPIDFFAPVGDLSIAASREALEYDKKTLRGFQEYFNVAIKEITEEFVKQMSQAKDIVEAKQCYKLLMREELANLSDIISASGGLHWNNQVINDYHFTIPDIISQATVTVPITTPVTVEDTEEDAEDVLESVIDSNNSTVNPFTVRMIEPTRTTTGYKTRFLCAGKQFEINNKAKVFYQDVNDKPILRIRKFFEDNPDVQKVYLFKPTTCTIDQIATESTVPRKYFTNISTQAPLTIENARNTGSYNIKHSRKVFQPAEVPGQRGTDSRYWDVAIINTDQEYYYVYIDRFSPKINNHCIANSRFRNILEEYHTLTGVNLRSRVIGIKTSATKQIAPNWKSLESVMTDGLINQISRVSEIVQNIEVRDLIHNYPILTTLGHCSFESQLETLAADSPMRRFYTRYRTVTTTMDDNLIHSYTALQNISNQLNLVFPQLEATEQSAEEAAEREIDQVLIRYPLLNQIAFRYGEAVPDFFNQAIANYIRLIDTQFETQLETVPES